MQVARWAARHTDQYLVSMTETRETILSIRADGLREAKVRHVVGTVARMIRNRRQVEVSGTSLDEGDLATASSIEPCGQRVEYELPGSIFGSAVSTACDQVQKMTPHDLDEWFGKVAERIRSMTEWAAFHAKCNRVVESRTLIGSGGELAWSRTVLAFYFNLVPKGLSAGAPLFVSYSSCRFPDSLDDFEHSLAWHLSAERQAARQASVPFVLTPRALARLMPMFETALNGGAVIRNTSSLAPHLGSRLLSPLLTVQDCGILDWAPGSGPVDEEGVPTTCTSLVKEGKVVGILYDLRTGSMRGCPSTGNGFRRSLEQPIEPRASNLVITPGKQTLDKVLANVGDAIILDQLVGGQVTWDSRFALTLARGYQLVRGRLRLLPPGGVVTGDLLTIWQNVLAVSKEREGIGQMVAPWVVVAPSAMVLKLERG